MADYWSKVLQRRMSRRRALAVTGGAAGAGLFLVACGGDDDEAGGNTGTGTGSSSATGSNNTGSSASNTGSNNAGTTGSSATTGSSGDSGLLTAPVDSSKQAKRGGTLKLSRGTDYLTLDPGAQSATSTRSLYIWYGRLLADKAGYLEAPPGEVEPDHAESYELSPDKLQIILKLRPGVKFHNRPPVNGREVDVDDILFSWARFSEKSSARNSVANSANPDAPVLSITAPDARTIIVNLKEPLVYSLNMLSHREVLNILPKEGEDTAVLDLQKTVLGSGPFYQADYQPSIGATYKRHEGYWRQGQPYIDQINFPIVSEYAAAIAQLRAGALHTYAVRQEDVVSLKKDVSDLSLYQSGMGTNSVRMFFGWQQPEVGDERVRQAMSMSIDRDLWIQTERNTEAFLAEGLPVEVRWHSALTASEPWTNWWLDPRNESFGPNAKYFQHNLEEAKALLAAAGYPDGLEIQSNHFTSGQYGPDFPSQVEVWEAMMAEAGFTFKKNIVEYSGEFLQKIRDYNGNFAGISYKTGPPPPTGDAINQLQYEYSVGGGAGFHGFDVNGTGDGSGDPTLEDLIAKAKAEFDLEQRRALGYDIQRHLGEKQYCIRWAGGASSFALVWPAVQNYRVYVNPLDDYLNWWIDPSQPPEA